ncbi:MAG: hypothetical protein M1825_003846 [Sarcosagium campestre]|nr:MAG: hypothetical protein M1825_003846 [Sarcosagium campestre]
MISFPRKDEWCNAPSCSSPTGCLTTPNLLRLGWELHPTTEAPAGALRAQNARISRLVLSNEHHNALQRYARMGGPDMMDIVGQRKHPELWTGSESPAPETLWRELIVRAGHSSNEKAVRAASPDAAAQGESREASGKRKRTGGGDRVLRPNPPKRRRFEMDR